MSIASILTQSESSDVKQGAMDPASKTNAFRLYDFESDSRWTEFLRRVDISGSDYNSKLLKLKAKWYKREVDPEFEFSWLEKHGTRDLRQETATNETPEPQSTRPAQGAAPVRQNPPHRAASSLIVLHLGILVLGVWSLVPLSPFWTQSYFLQLVILSSVVKMVVYHGRPKLRPFAELKLWLQRVLSTTDTQYGFMALLFIRSVPTRLIFVPSTILALYHVSSYLNTIFGTSRWWVKYGQSRYQKLAQNQNSALLLNAVSEIGVAMIMSVQLIKSFRSVLTVVLYWQWLRLRYHSPDASWYHRQAWANVGQRLNPILDMVPFLKGPLGYAKQWFTNMR